MFELEIKMSIISNNLIEINFKKCLFNAPNTIIDTQNKNQIIEHTFKIFVANIQENSFDGCNKWFEVIHIKIPDIYDLFSIKTVSEITCCLCNFSHISNIAYEHAISIPIDNKVQCIQDAINLFQENELLTVNCDKNECKSMLGQRSFLLLETLAEEAAQFLLEKFKPQKIRFPLLCYRLKHRETSD